MDPALAQAAQVLAHTALKLRPGARLVIIEDAGSAVLGDAISAVVEASGGWVKRARLDLLTGANGACRPHKVVPELLLLGLHDADASVFLASSLSAEMPMRQALLHVVRTRGLRHAHMPGIGMTSFIAGLRLDYEQVERVGARVLERLRDARSIVAVSPVGTSLRVSIAPDSRWFAQLGSLEPGLWGNLPAGALYASPADVSGVFVADASLGEFFGAREGLLRTNPVRFVIDEGRVVDVQTLSPQLGRDLESMLAASPNSRRVGLVSIGVNLGIGAAVGDAMVDQNVPGLHLGIGDPASRSTGATWTAPTCFAACQVSCRVVVDGDVLIDAGRIVLQPSRSTPALRLDSPPPDAGS